MYDRRNNKHYHVIKHSNISYIGQCNTRQKYKSSKTYKINMQILIVKKTEDKYLQTFRVVIKKISLLQVPLSILLIGPFSYCFLTSCLFKVRIHMFMGSRKLE